MSLSSRPIRRYRAAVLAATARHSQVTALGRAGLSAKPGHAQRARRLISGASFEVDTLATLGKIFDEVWASVAADFGDDPKEIEEARIRLATIVLALAKDHQLGPLEIARTASRLIYQAGAKGKVSL